MGWVFVPLGALLVAATAAWLALIGRMWVLRHDFYMKARSPAMVVVTMVTCFLFSTSVLWSWFLRSVGSGLPCWIVFILSYSTYGCAVVPYLIRGVRLVVAYNKELRQRYARFVKWTPLMCVLGGTNVLLAVRASLFYGNDSTHHSSDARECFYWDDLLCVYGFILFGGAPALVLAKSLSNVQDAYRLREELMPTIAGCCFLAGVVAFVQTLVNLKVMEDSAGAHVAAEVLSLLWGINAGFWSLVVPLTAHQKRQQAQGKRRVIPVETASQAEIRRGVPGVIEIARAGGELGTDFEQFCRKYLCMESYDFLVTVCKYEAKAVASTPDELFDAYVTILEQYLLPTSPDEVNVSSSMSKRVASFNSREKFNGLDNEARRTIFDDSLNEIARMLEQNLLDKFRRHVAEERGKRLLEAVAGDKELMMLVSVSSADNG